VRFCKAHGNEFLKNEFSHLLSIFPQQVLLHSIFQLSNHIFFC
jgi:hypothetical protein